MRAGVPCLFPSVLVVEDEPLTRMDAVDAIEASGIPTHEAADAAEALQAILDCPDIKLVFTDINMPGGFDGLELASKVCSQHPDMKFIVTSGAVDLADYQLPGSGTFLPKPYTASRLLRLIDEKLLEHRSYE